MLRIIKTIRIFQNTQGKEPYSVWYDKLSKEDQTRIDIRLSRIYLGNWGDFKKITRDIFELRFHFGSAYRIYCALENDVVVILLCAGNKSSQARDIAKAKEYFQEYKEKKNG